MNNRNAVSKFSWLAFLWLCLSSCAISKQKGDSFYFIQMSDTQFGFFNDNRSFEQETEHFRKAIQQANRLKPAFVVITGDLVNRPHDAAQVAEFQRLARELNANIPLYLVAGNHDVGNTPTEASIEAYKKTFGADYYSFTHQSMLGIVLNSLYLKEPQAVPAQAKAQEEWLVKTLQEAKQRGHSHVVVFLHHPLFLNKGDEGDEYFNIPLATRQKYLAIFKASGIDYVFAGHYHRNALGKDGNLHMITTGPVGKPLGKDSSGLRIITVKGKELQYPYYPLEAVPERIRF